MILSSDDLPIIYTIANDCIPFILDALTQARGVHLETAVTLAGSLAGVSILRSAVKEMGLNLSDLIRTQPGAPIFIEKANDIGQEVSEFMIAICKPLKLDPQSGWTQPIPEDNTPQRLPVDLVRDFEAPFITLVDKQNLKADLRPFVAALTGLKLIIMGIKELNPDITKALLLSAMVASSKTVPSN